MASNKMAFSFQLEKMKLTWKTVKQTKNFKNVLAVERKVQKPVKNAAATTKRLLGTGAVQQYESRSTPLKPKGRQTLSRNKKPINTNVRRPKKQQTSSSSSSDSETTLEKIGNRPNPKYKYVMK